MKMLVVKREIVLSILITVVLLCGLPGISYARDCQVGDVLSPGESCTDPGTGDDFSVLENGFGQYLFARAGGGISMKGNINGKLRNFVADKRADGKWEIKSVTEGGNQQTVVDKEPDLVVTSARVSNTAVSPGENFTLSATVKNEGDGSASATTLRYYRSTDSRISSNDTEVGTDSVSVLGANRTNTKSISLTASMAPGTYYYGVCVDDVTNESDTDNNCSNAVSVTVQPPMAPGEKFDSSVDASVDVLIYTGDVWWITRSEAIAEAETTKRLLQSAGIQAEITENENHVKQWMLQTASDDSVDVLILYGLIPTTIYPPGNAMPDGSVAENWIETLDGNTILNHADYLGYWGTGNINLEGQVGEWNGEGTLRNLMDIPNISIPVDRYDISMFVTTDDSALTPSLVNFQSDRPFPLNHLQGDWFAEKILASNTGNTQAIQADPVILRDGNRGRIAIVHQTAFENNPKGEVAAEIIINYLLADATISISPDLVVEAIQAEPSTIAPGETFRLYATLKNQGTGESTATTLRYYRSSNATISTQDTRLRSANRNPLAANATIRRYLTVTAPTTPGTYYYGACVDSVTDESDTSNNCSRAVSVTVTAPPVVSEDVNDDGVVDVQDLVYIAQRYGQTGTTTADVNDDGVVNIDDLILVAAALDAEAAAAPSLYSDALKRFSVSDVQLWLSQARQRDVADPRVRRGILFLEQLLASMVPKETVLLANYPNPFNPETWIPYHLAKDADVTLRIYAVDGHIVRTLSLGHQPAGIYQNRSRAAYWDGRNAFGEPVASGVYFYTLTAGDFSATRKMLIRK